jgi:hypothetical protein
VQNSYQLDDNDNKNGNISMENGKDSETSSVCSKPDEHLKKITFKKKGKYEVNTDCFIHIISYS